MPAAHSPEFRRRALDLVAEGPCRPDRLQSWISESCLRNWMNRDAVDSGRKVRVTTDEHEEPFEQHPVPAAHTGAERLAHAARERARAAWLPRPWSLVPLPDGRAGWGCVDPQRGAND